MSTQETKSLTSIDYVIDIGAGVDFGKTAMSAYTPEIRANMKQLYDDKFGLFVHFGPYAQLSGIMIWQSGKNRVANNLIHHMPYCGMIISGCMTHFFERNGREFGRTIRRHEIGNLPRSPKLEDIRPYLKDYIEFITRD